MWCFILWVYVTTISCITFVKEKGLLTVQEKKIMLSTLEGKEYHIHAGPDQKYLLQLPGCILNASGITFFSQLYIETWSIQDAGSGSAPFLGKLERQGIQWMIKDHNTKGVLFLEALEDHIQPEQGRIILIGGYVVGQQRIRVVSARYLSGEK